VPVAREEPGPAEVRTDDRVGLTVTVEVGAPTPSAVNARSAKPSPSKSGTAPQLPARPLSRAGMTSSQTRDISRRDALTRQNTTPCGSGCDGRAEPPAAMKDSIVRSQERSRQMSTRTGA